MMTHVGTLVGYVLVLEHLCIAVLESKRVRVLVLMTLTSELVLEVR